MKKSLIPALLLTLGIAGGSIWAASTIWSQHDDVAFRQNILTGDASAADGLTVHMAVSESNHQFWDIRHTLGKEPETEVSYDYALLADDERMLGPISANTMAPITMNIHLKDYGPQISELDPDGIPAEFLDLAEKYTEDGNNTKTIPAKDLMMYYPIQVELEFPDMHAAWTSDAWWSSLHSENDKGAMAKALSTEFQDFFRLPLSDDIDVTLRIDHPYQNYVLRYDYSTDSDFRIACKSVLTGDSCYFAFNAQDSESKPLDVSQIRDGFGIYKLLYNSQDGILPELSTIYRIDPAAEIQHLEISPSQDVLHLHTRENGRYMITFIDLATGQELQKLTVGNQETGTNGSDVIMGEDWILLRNGRLEYILISRQTDGTYAETLHINIPLSEVPWDEEKADAITATSDGRRIALASSTQNYFYNGGDFFTAIYGPEGLEYYAEYESSLKIRISSGNFIRTNDLQLEWN